MDRVEELEKKLYQEISLVNELEDEIKRLKNEKKKLEERIKELMEDVVYGILKAYNDKNPSLAKKLKSIVEIYIGFLKEQEKRGIITRERVLIEMEKIRSILAE